MNADPSVASPAPLSTTFSTTLPSSTLHATVVPSPTTNAAPPETNAHLLIKLPFFANMAIFFGAWFPRLEEMLQRRDRARRRRERNMAVGARGNWSGRREVSVGEREGVREV